MRCPRCRHDHKGSARFCEECGAPLSRTCAGCGGPLSPTAKFCPECAQPTGVAGAASPSPSVGVPEGALRFWLDQAQAELPQTRP
jgi:adenylate cyclase